MSNTDPVIVTHNGKFHEDDIFAVATLELYLAQIGKKGTVVRTRDPEKIQTADFVVDVGGIYDPEKLRFDHHQVGMAGERDDVPYASFGLVWKQYGEMLCGGDKEVARAIEKKLVMPIDAIDNSQFFVRTAIKGLYPYTIHDFFDTLRPTWREPLDWDVQFTKAVEIARHVIEREIIEHKDLFFGRELARNVYSQATDKRLLVTDTFIPLSDLAEQFSDVLFVVFPNEVDNTWILHTLSVGESHQNRKDLPVAWAGKRDAELEAVTGVSGSIFCHNKLFIAITKTKEAAVALAAIALAA